MNANNDLPSLPEPDGKNDVYGEVHYYYYSDVLWAYARSCVAHATAAKDAEIEALRAENASLRHHGTLLSNIAYNLAQDDRLPDGMRWSLDDARKRWDAALHPTDDQARGKGVQGEA